jgi:Ca-activated chloride channel homolog
MNTQRLTLTIAVVVASATLFACATPAPGPKLVEWEVTGSHPYLLAGEETNTVVHLEIGAKLPDTEQERIPLNLSLVVDHSGSMTKEQLDDSKKAVRYVLSELRPEDTVSVIAFSSRVEVLQNQEPWDDVDRKELYKEIADLEARGTTNMTGALQTALAQVRTRFDGGRLNRIILISDGIPNDPSQLSALADGARSSQIAISTFGLGPHYNEDLMADLADRSGGNYRFIQKSGDIQEYFAQERQGLEQVVARNATVTVTLGPGVSLDQALGAQASYQGNNQLSIFIGDLGVSDKRAVALKLKVKAPASGANVELIDATLTWEDVVFWDGYKERLAYLQAESTKDQAKIDKHHDKIVEEKVGRLLAAWEAEQAIRDYEAGNREQAERRLNRAADDYKRRRLEAQASTPSYDAKIAVDAPISAPQAAEAGSAYLDDWLLDTAVELQADDGDVDEGEDKAEEEDRRKVLIKKTKRGTRSVSGQ